MTHQLYTKKISRHPVFRKIYGITLCLGLFALMAFRPVIEEEALVADCGVTSTLLTAPFNSGAEGFSYQDDPFFSTFQPGLASGTWSASAGRSGGGLRVSLGGGANATVTNMSGGWAYTFNLPEAASVALSFYYNLQLAANYETDEYGDAYFSIDGNEYFLARLIGDNNGGNIMTTGWQLVNANLGQLSAGSHTVIIGAYNNKKTWSDEITEIFIDDVSLTSTSGLDIIESTDFESGYGSWVDGGSDATLWGDAFYANSGSYSIRLRDNSGAASATWNTFDLSAYDEITIDFSFVANSMEPGEDFFLELSTDNGGSYSIIRDYDSGDEFFNNIRYNESVSIPGPFTANSRIRFRCDATANGDQVYIDDIVIRGCTANTGDTQAPSVPQNLIASNITGESVELTWDPASDDVGVTGYYIYQNGNLTPVATVTGTSTTITGLAYGSTHQFAVAAFDAAGNVSGQSQAIQITTLENGSPVVSLIVNPTAGTAPLVVSFDASGSTDPEGDDITFAWDFGDGNTASGPTASHTYQNEGTFTASVTITDGFENSTTETVTISVTSTPDTEAPSIPQNLIASNVTGSSVDLDWDASTDNVAVAGYYVYQDGNATPVATVTGTSTTIQGLAEGSTYSYTVAAFDAAGNVSGTSQAVQITTDINQAPTASFTANPTTGEAPLLVNFDASASTDPDGDALTYSWDFGDGNSGSGVSPSHTFQSEGTYTVTLTLSDGQGNSDNATATITVTPSSECVPVVVDSEDFESGWGIWIDGGTDAARVNNASFANSGSHSIELRDNSATSFMTTGSLDLSGYGEITVAFSFIANSFDSSSEDFRLQMSNDGGAFNLVEEWNRDDEFVNGQRVNDIVTIPGPFSTDTRLRFRCDATADGDQVYIDDIVISACPAEQVPPSIPQNLSASNIRENSVFLTWDPSTDNIGVAGYYVYQNGNPTPVATVTGTQTTIDGLNSLTTYSFTVAAFDASGNISSPSQPVQITTTGACTQVTLYEDDFEEGEGIWQEVVPPNGAFTPGSFRINDPNSASSGNYVVVIQGDYANSRISTKAIDLSAYEEIQFNFTVKPFEYFNNRDGFFLQMSLDGGNTYTNIEEYNIGAGTLIEAVFMDKQVNITGPFTNQTKFRFQADVNNTRGYGPAHFDDISIKVCKLDSCIGTGNIALNRPATQSSTYGNGGANNGVDGVVSGNSPWTPNIVHTDSEAQPWWEVDLGTRSQIDSLILFNRETSQNRLKDFYVLVSDNPMNGSLASLLQDNSVTYMYYPGLAGAESHVPVNLEGRYVRIQLEGTSFLHFAEAQLIGCNLDQPCVVPSVSIDPAGPFYVDGTMEQLSASPAGGVWSGFATADGMFDPTQGTGFYEVIYTYESAPGCTGADTLQIEVRPVTFTCETPGNIALNRPASQSSTYGNGVADFAVDGALGGSSPWTADLQHTTDEVQPWWEVDLGGNSKIDSVLVFNRSSSQERLRDFYVLISSTPMEGSLDALLQDNTITAVYHPGQAGPVARLGADVEGRYVRIHLTGSGILHIDEVEVIGCNLEQVCVTPIVQIDPVGPVEEASAPIQLTASPAGGVWSGSVAADGTFDPVVGVGTYQAIYTYEEFPGCTGADTLQIEVRPVTFTCETPGNIALNRPASQSSTYGNGVADFAVDGALGGSSPWTADLQHTTDEVQPWWEVDLGGNSKVDSVLVFNRSSSQERLRDFYVLISSTPMEGSLDALLQDNTITAIYHPGQAGPVARLGADVEGRYVRIHLTGSGILHIDEVEVIGCNLEQVCVTPIVQIDPVGPVEEASAPIQLTASPAGGVWSGSVTADGTFDPVVGVGTYQAIYTYEEFPGCEGADTVQIQVAPLGSVCSTPVNLAFNKFAEQSSTYGNGLAGIAVDGNTDGSSPWTADLSHTEVEFQPWWQVDLGSLSDIQEVVIHNRTDCCQGRLNNFYVLYSATPFDTSMTLDQLLADPTVSNVNFSGSAGLLETISIGAEARYVRIQHTRDIQLHMAEVQVIGCISQNDPCFGAETATIAPIPSLTPNSGTYQLSALPAGGEWSGAANPDGTFTAEACPGSYEVIYTYLNGGQCMSADTATILVQNDTVDVFIYAGQSNATGAQNAAEVLSVGTSPYDAQIAYAWNIPGTAISTGWDYLQPVQIDATRQGHGAEISFGRTLFEAGYNNLAIIKVAKGGTNLANHWDPNSALNGVSGNDGMYPEMINYVSARLAELDAAGTPYRLRGFLWHQGEGDMNPSMANIYEANLAELIAALRTDLANDLPVYAASVYNPNATVNEEEAVRKAQRDVAAADPLTFVVNLDSVYFDDNFNPNSENLIVDNLHYNSEGQLKIGSSFANTFQVFNPLTACEETGGGSCANPENLALNKPASQSSTYGNGVAALAVDGNRTGTSPWSADLQHTTVEFQPWWQVDLGQISSIEEVVIFNRSDCCAGRLNNFYIMWSDQPFDSTASLDELLVDPTVSNVNFSGNAGLLENIAIESTGRYVRLQHTRDIQLHIPEIEVMGCPVVGQGSRFETVAETPVSETLEPSASVFPNPASTRVDIQLANVEENAVIEYSLYNMTGQRVWQKVGGRIENLNVERFARGTYILKIQGSDWTQTQKLMVQ